MFPEKPVWFENEEEEHGLEKLTHDEWMAYTFLAGYNEVTPQGWGKSSYLQGENETLGRDALIQVLLDDKPIPQKIREALADLFSEEENRDDRRLILKFRSKNSGDISGKDRFITVFVGKELRRLGGKKEAAVESAVKKLALSDRRFLMP